ncbi:MAG: HAD family hydrolase, partial [Clostridiales bacterium]|nr:HAD family hydrolase [Clostridiales bacterium]
MSIKVVIFDFDGTLADTRKTIVLAKQETMRFAGLEVKDEETCASTIGYSARAGFKKLYPDITEDLLDVLVPKYRSTFDALIQEMPPELFPGTRKVLSDLKEK